MCGFCKSNILFARYDDIMTSDDYPEIIGIYGQRVAQQGLKRHQQEQQKNKTQHSNDR